VTIHEFVARLKSAKACGDRRWMAPCPAHDDRMPSLSVTAGTGGKILVCCHAGCDTAAICDSLGLKVGDLFEEPLVNGKAEETLDPREWPVTAVYEYFDAVWVLKYRVSRLTSPDSGRKSFRQESMQGGKWVPSMTGVERILYHAPQLAKSTGVVFLVEGERDVESVEALGLTATTKTGGSSSKWEAGMVAALKGRSVVVLPDNDVPGEKAATLAQAALGEACESVKVLKLPGLPPSGDVTDWIGAGGTAEKLLAMVARLEAGPRFLRSPERLSGERARRLDDGKSLLHFGVQFLDDAFGGITRQDLVLVGAKSGAGKTALVSGISLANCTLGKRVHQFQLEAEDIEIERRMKFTILASKFFASGTRSNADIRYINWRNGKLEQELGPFDSETDAELRKILANLSTYYRINSFTSDDFSRLFASVQDETDLVVLDHFHYVDVDDKDEYRGQKKILQQIRDSALRADRPVIVVGHIRKSSGRYDSVVPNEDAFHGSSDLVKISTKAIMIAPDYETPSPGPGQWSTYMRIVKCRADSSLTRYVAKLTFDTRTNSYLPHYTLGRLDMTGQTWEALTSSEWPRWYKSSPGADGRPTPPPVDDPPPTRTRIPDRWDPPEEDR